MARRSDDDVVEQLLARQRAHPSVDAVPIAAKIGDVSLFIGEAKAAQDIEFLQQHKITHVVSLGTGRLSPASCNVLLVDILDMEDQLIVCHFNECIEFLRSALADSKSAVLVHCVYGQSRSAAVCVAYLTACKQMSMLEAYNAVQQARPCIYINPGFLSQLQLFERMERDANLLGPTNAHAELRALIAARQRVDSGVVQLLDIPIQAGQAYHCSKCSLLLCTKRNELPHGKAHTSGDQRGCTSIFLEPMKWMSTQSHSSTGDFGYEKEGKLNCPKCSSKLGSWNWVGVKCACGGFVAPAFQLVPSRVRFRP